MSCSPPSPAVRPASASSPDRARSWRVSAAAFSVLSAFGSGLLFRGLPENTIRWIGCIALVCIGLMQIVSGFGSELLARLSHRLPGHLRRTAEISRDYTKADADGNKTLSPSEAFVLAIPVSIDSLIGGLSISTNFTGLILRFVIGLVCGYLCVFRQPRRLPHPDPEPLRP